MRFLQSLVLGLSGFLALVAFGAVAVRAQTTPLEATENRQAPAEPDTTSEAVLDAASNDYARAFGVTAAEGRRRARIARAARRLQAQLESGAADNFAGLEIEHAPRFRIVARFRNNPTASLLPSSAHQT